MTSLTSKPETGPDPDTAPETAMERLLWVMAWLRTPEFGCAWDLQQDFSTIAPYTIEEAYEVADAITLNDMAALKEELGDLLLQVVFHARMAEEAGHFDFADVAAAIAEKMLQRHPHVFTPKREQDIAALHRNWEQMKAAERQQKANGENLSALDGVAKALPALLRAHKLQKRAARVGFDWPEWQSVLDKVHEEIAEVTAAVSEPENTEAIEDEVGDLLFSVANLSRHLGVEPEQALRKANAKFERRFRGVEDNLKESSTPTAGEVGLERLEAEWRAVKAAESKG